MEKYLSHFFFFKIWYSGNGNSRAFSEIGELVVRLDDNHIVSSGP